MPYILEVQKAPRRFSVKVNSDNTMDLQFGSGDVSMPDETILPNSKNVGLGLSNSIQRLNQGIDPSNFLKTNTFGISPAGKTLLVKYLVGGGVESNINTGDLTTIRRIEFEEDLLSVVDLTTYSQIKSSVAVENLEPAVGGRSSESIEEIRQNALATFGSRNINAIGIIKLAMSANMSSASFAPKLVSKPCSTGIIKNCPNDPAAAVIPIAHTLFSGATLRPKMPYTTL